MTDENRATWQRIGLAVLVPLLVGLVGYGMLKSDVTHVEQRLAEEIPKAVITHDQIEARTDAKVLALRELILAELRAINQRLDRIDRKLP